MASSSRRPSTIRNTDRNDDENSTARFSYRIDTQNSASRTMNSDQLYSLFMSLVAEVHRTINVNARPFVAGIINRDISTVDFGSKFVGRGRSFSVRYFRYDRSDCFAIKSILPFGDFTSREEKERLGDIVLELRALSHGPLRGHPNIIELLGLCWETDSVHSSRKWPVVILELADGGHLEDYLQHYPELPFLDRLTLCQGVADGLQALHRCAIVHGDLKPANVLVCRRTDQGQQMGWTAKLADFGGCVLDVEESQFGRLAMGSFPWQAPEWRNWLSREGLLKTDVYSLGLTIWSVMAGGREPIRGDLDIFGLEMYRDDPAILEESIATMKSKHGTQCLQNLMLAGERHFASDVDTTTVRDALSITVATDPSQRNLDRLCGLVYFVVARTGNTMPIEFSIADKLYSSPAQITQIHNIETILMAPDTLDALSPTIRTYVASRLEDTYQRNLEQEKRSLSAFSLAVEALRRQEDPNSETKCLEWLLQSAQNGNETARSLVYRFHHAFNQSVPDPAASQTKEWVIHAAERNFPAAQEDLKLVATYEQQQEVYARIRTRYANMGYNRFAFLYHEVNISSLDEVGRRLRDRMLYEMATPDFTPRQFNVNSTGDNLLHFAASSGLDTIIQLWANPMPVDINALGEANESPLLHACRSGHFNTAMTLLRLGADPRLCSLNGDTPLHWILSFEGSQAQELGENLVQAGADVNAVAKEITYPFSPLCSYEYGTPLHRAVGRGNADAIVTLLALGALPGHTGNREDKRCPIYLSAQYHRPDILSLLLQALGTQRPAAKPYKGISLLVAAVHGRDFYGLKFTMIATHGAQWACKMRETFDIILEYGGSDHLHGFPNTFDCAGSNPLIIATCVGIPESVQYFIDKGCQSDINIRANPFPGKDESTPLSEAIFRGRSAIFDILLSNGADISQPYFKDEDTPLSTLWQCAYAGHNESSFARKLLAKGASVNEGPKNYEPAFALALRNRSFELAEFLLKNGADPHVEYNQGLFLESSEPGTVLEFLIREQTRCTLACLDWLFREVPDVNFVVSTQAQRTALHICASAKIWSRNEAEEGACKLIADTVIKHFKPSKAQIDHKDTKGQTALFYAVMTNNYEMAKILLDYGANSKISDISGISPVTVNNVLLEILEDKPERLVDSSDPRPVAKQITRKQTNQSIIQQYFKTIGI